MFARNHSCSLPPIFVVITSVCNQKEQKKHCASSPNHDYRRCASGIRSVIELGYSGEVVPLGFDAIANQGRKIERRW
jgi:hypothetical protein